MNKMTNDGTDLSGGVMTAALASELLARQNYDGSWASLPPALIPRGVDDSPDAAAAKIETFTRVALAVLEAWVPPCLLYTSPSPRDA